VNRRTALAAGGAFLAAPALAGAQTLTAVHIGGVPEESVTPALWAQQSGAFRRAGLDVDLQAQSSGAVIAAAVAGGAYAFGKSSLVSIVIAHSRGLPFVFVASGSLYDAKNASTQLVVKADSAFKTAADLNGKTYGAPAINDLTTVATKAWMDQHGGDSTTLKVLEFPFSAVADAIASGRIDSGAIGDPALQSAVDSGKVREFAHMFDAIAPEFMITGWVATTDYVAKNGAVVAAFARTLRDATAYVGAHPSETVAMLAKFSGSDPKQIEKTHRLAYAPGLEPKYLQPVINVCAKYKVIPAPFDAKELIAPGLH
jgi:NitT/TauT family transport system substrate-binding protein